MSSNKTILVMIWIAGIFNENFTPWSRAVIMQLPA